MVHGVPRAVILARKLLDDESITESQFRHWLDAGKVRYRRFGGRYAFRPDELAEDLAGKTVT